MSARSIRRSHARELRGGSRRRAATIATGAVLGAGAVFAPGAGAANLLVTQLNDVASDGTCDANCTLRDAIDSANAAPDADVITFQSGLTGTTTVTLPLEIDEDVSIQGPGAASIAVSGGDTSRVFFVDPPTADPPTVQVSISGLTIEDGATGPSISPYDDDGGAIKGFFADLTLDHVTLSGNHAEDQGGAVSFRAGNLTLTNSHVTGNTAEDQGGGVFAATYYEDLRTRISDTTFTGNAAGDPAPTDPYGSPRGGAMSINGPFTVSGVTMTGNSAVETFGTDPDGFGGAAQLSGQGGRSTLSGSTITGNHAGRNAGGVAIANGDVVDSTIAGNDAGVNGGGVDMNANSSLQGTTVSGNTSAAGGGAYVGGLESNVAIKNSTISGNHATGGAPYGGLGGGVMVYADSKYTGILNPGRLTVRGSTIASNSATVAGSGVYAYADTHIEGDPFVTLKGTIVADNSGGGDIGQNRVDAAFAAGFSLVENAGGASLVGDPAGSNLTGVDPGLSPLADNGGPTRTMALAPTSPAVDASQSFGLTADQRGAARPVDSAASNQPLSDGTDMGSFEVQDAAATGDDDVTPPQTKITKKPPKKLKAKGERKLAKASFSFSGTDERSGTVTFECRIDKEKFDTCVSPFKVKLPKGKHTFAVRAIDAAGNEDGSPAEATVKVKAQKTK